MDQSLMAKTPAPMTATTSSEGRPASDQLLSVSSRFESPNPVMNLFRALELLGSLSQFTQVSLVTLQATPSAPENKPQIQPTPPTKTVPAPQKPSKDQYLLDALMKLRDTQKSMRKTPGIYQPIIRATSIDSGNTPKKRP